jgi:hypothetical protein
MITLTPEIWKALKRINTEANAPKVLQFDFHHQIDTPGSRIEWVK